MAHSKTGVDRQAQKTPVWFVLLKTRSHNCVFTLGVVDARPCLSEDLLRGEAVPY